MTKKVLTLLRLDPQPKPVYFVVEAGYADDDPNVDETSTAESLNRYYFEEGSCPTNFVRCELIVSEGDTDPHGIFEWVRTVERPECLSRTHDPGVEWPVIFPEAFEKKAD